MTMRRRAMGQETEYGCAAMGSNGKPLLLDETLAAMLRYGREGDATTHRWWQPNGHCVYKDIGSHVEDATGECDSPWEVAHHVLAGDRNLWDLADRFTQFCQTTDRAVRLSFFKNNVCDYATERDYQNPGFTKDEKTFGSHENYQVSESLMMYVEPLLAYMATRQLVLGAGRLVIDAAGRTMYELAQRSGFLHEKFTTGTTSNRPLVNLRDEPHAGAKYGRRLHVISGDNNILPQQTALRFGTMNVLLTMIEEGRLKTYPILRNAVTAVQSISKVPGIRCALQNRPGSLTALDVGQMYFDQAWSFVTSDEELAPGRLLIAKWGEHLDRLRRSYDRRTRTYPYQEHVGELCWATKEHYIRPFLERNPDAPRERKQAVELSLHHVNSSTALLQRVMDRWGQYDEAAVETARTTPPATRARARVQLAQLPGAKAQDWEYVQVGESRLSLPDPLDPTLPGIIEERPAA